MVERDNTKRPISRRRFLLGIAAGVITYKGIAANLSLDSSPSSPPPSLDFRVFSKERNAEINNPFKIENPDSGQRLSVLFLNRDEMSKNKEPIITTSTFGSSLLDEQVKFNLALIADRTNRPVLAYDRYGIGYSDDLTQAQKDGLAGDEGLFPIAGSVAQSLRRFKVPGNRIPFEIKRAYVAGNSMGASLGSAFLAVAPEAGINIPKAILVEPVGIINFSFEELVNNFLSDGKGELSPALLGLLNTLDSMIKSEDSSNFYYVRALMNSFVPGALTEALTVNNELTILVGHGTESELCPEENIQKMIQNLDSKFTDRVKNYPFKGYGHKIFGANPSWSLFLEDQFNSMSLSNYR